MKYSTYIYILHLINDFFQKSELIISTSILFIYNLLLTNSYFDCTSRIKVLKRKEFVSAARSIAICSHMIFVSEFAL